VSLKGKLLAVDPGVNEGGIVDVESMVWVIGMSRGAGDGFVDGAEVDFACPGPHSRPGKDSLQKEGTHTFQTVG